MSKTEHQFFDRMWLNKPGYHSNAFVQTEVISDKKDKWVDATISISDCSRTIHLDFGSYGGDKLGTIENNLYKLNLLIEQLDAFREEYTEAIARLDIKGRES